MQRFLSVSFNSVLKLLPSSEVIGYSMENESIYQFRFKGSNCKGSYKEHNPIGQGLARELMLCHKTVLNARPEGYISTGRLHNTVLH